MHPNRISCSQSCVRVGALITLIMLSLTACQEPDNKIVREYVKKEVQIPMRDGVHLYAAVYIPRDQTQTYPFLIKKSPYSSGPYGPDSYPNHLGPNGSDRFADEGYIFVYEDVRGRFMSEGRFVNMTPDIPTEKDSTDVDEGTDMYDTVDWLLRNVEPNNGRAGIWGISYPGFYAAASSIDSHPALLAASPQAPIADWFVGDDFHHHGAFYLQDAFRFFPFFESPDPNPTDHWNAGFDFPTDDAYQFFLDMGPLKNANEKYFHGKIAFWDSLMAHGTYDTFWKRRNIVPNMTGVTTNMMTVGWLFSTPRIPMVRRISTSRLKKIIRLQTTPWSWGRGFMVDGSAPMVITLVMCHLTTRRLYSIRKKLISHFLTTT